MLNMTVMLNRMYGKPECDISKYYGLGIVEAELKSEETIYIKFLDGRSIELFDQGQTCCESRHISTDDDIANLVGNNLVKIEIKEGDTRNTRNDEEWSDHEIQFLEITTDKNFVTVVAHNEHNGYYGGFSITLRENEASTD